MATTHDRYKYSLSVPLDELMISGIDLGLAAPFNPAVNADRSTW